MNTLQEHMLVLLRLLPSTTNPREAKHLPDQHVTPSQAAASLTRLQQRFTTCNLPCGLHKLSAAAGVAGQAVEKQSFST